MTTVRAKVLVSVLALILAFLGMKIYTRFYPIEMAEVDEGMQREALHHLSARSNGGPGCVVRMQTAARPSTRKPEGLPSGGSLWYANNLVATFSLIIRGDEPDAWCMRVQDHVYVFVKASTSSVCRLGHELCDPGYVSVSRDGGRLWSKLTSWNTLTRSSFAMPYRQGFFRQVQVLGDSNHHVITFFNGRDDVVYLFDSDLGLLRKLSVFARLGVARREKPGGLLFANGILYVAGRECETGQEASCDHHWIDWSSDYGRTWQRTPIPPVIEFSFLEVNGAVHQFYTRRDGCEGTLLEALAAMLVPVLDSKLDCRLLETRQLISEGAWTELRTVSRTAGSLRGAFATDDGALLFWVDLRAQRPMPCGFIPVVECFFGGPTRYIPRLYAGILDLKTLRLREGYIHGGFSGPPFLDSWEPNAPVGVQPPAM